MLLTHLIIISDQKPATISLSQELIKYLVMQVLQLHIGCWYNLAGHFGMQTVNIHLHR